LVGEMSSGAAKLLDVPMVLRVERSVSGAAGSINMAARSPPPQQLAADTAKSIVIPGVVHTGVNWVSAVEQAAECRFELPPACRVRPASGARPVRYIADHVDRKWLTNYLMLGRGAASSPQAAGGKTLGKAGGPPSSSLSSSPSLTLIGLEDVFTLLEVAAFRSPELPIERIDISSSTINGELRLARGVVDDVRRYWVERRVATGTKVPLVAQLRGPIEETRQDIACHRDLLEGLPLPFSARDWQLDTTVRSNPPSSSAASTRDSQLRAFCDSARALAQAVVQREAKKLELALVTVYELAALRRATAWSPADDGAAVSLSSCPTRGTPLSAAGLACLQQLASCRAVDES
jgi:hypothetical protein